jgi:uncharacterized protein YbbC (DUF1343 family)
MPQHAGITYQPVHFKPFYSTFKGESCQGIQMHWQDPKAAADIVQINYELIALLDAQRLFPLADMKARDEALALRAEAFKKKTKATTKPFGWDPRTKMFDKVSGSDEPRTWLMDGQPLSEMFAKWKRECEQFRADRRPYLLY